MKRWETYAVLAGLAAGGYVLWRLSRAASETAANVAAAVNPLSRDNVFYAGVNSFGGAIAGDQAPGRNADGSWSLGGWAYDITHADPLAEKPAPVKPSPSGAGWPYDTPGVTPWFGA